MAKILLISCKDNNFYNFRKEFIFRLVDEGHDVVLACPYGKKIDCFIEYGCRFVDVPIDRRGKNIINDYKLIREYIHLLEKETPHIVLTYTGKPSIYGGYVCGQKKIPYIVNNAGLMETKGMFDKFMKLLYWIGFHKASCMMFQNSQERDVINRVLNGKVHYRDIPGSGVNLAEFSYKPYPKENKVITFNYVARIVEIKGINEFLLCAKAIKAEFPNTRFVIYGEFDDNSYRELVNRYIGEGIVEYGGVLFDMRSAIASAHAVIHPSYYEGMTNVVLEHSAMGRVCIGSDIPGVVEGIEDGKTGYVFKVRDVNSMVQVVKTFLALTDEEREQMGKAAREKMEREFNRQIIIDAYLEEISHCLQE